MLSDQLESTLFKNLPIDADETFEIIEKLDDSDNVILFEVKSKMNDTDESGISKSIDRDLPVVGFPRNESLAELFQDMEVLGNDQSPELVSKIRELDILQEHKDYLEELLSSNEPEESRNDTLVSQQVLLANRLDLRQDEMLQLELLAEGTNKELGGVNPDNSDSYEAYKIEDESLLDEEFEDSESDDVESSDFLFYGDKKSNLFGSSDGFQKANRSFWDQITEYRQQKRSVASEDDIALPNNEGEPARPQIDEGDVTGNKRTSKKSVSFATSLQIKELEPNLTVENIQSKPKISRFKQRQVESGQFASIKNNAKQLFPLSVPIKEEIVECNLSEQPLDLDDTDSLARDFLRDSSGPKGIIIESLDEWNLMRSHGDTDYSMNIAKSETEQLIGPILQDQVIENPTKVSDPIQMHAAVESTIFNSNVRESYNSLRNKVMSSNPPEEKAPKLDMEEEKNESGFRIASRFKASRHKPNK